tara:strand:- start:328 stop:1344 length:1017 start_codon:yes stop_codon:yes gene_type:complete
VYDNFYPTCFAANKTPDAMEITFTGIKSCVDDSDFTVLNQKVCLYRAPSLTMSYQGYIPRIFEGLPGGMYQVRYDPVTTDGGACVSIYFEGWDQPGGQDNRGVYFNWSGASCALAGSNSYGKIDCNDFQPFGSVCDFGATFQVKGYGGSFVVEEIDACGNCCGDNCNLVSNFLDVSFSGVGDCGTHFDACHATDLNGQTYTVEFRGSGFVSAPHLFAIKDRPPELDFELRGLPGCVWYAQIGDCSGGHPHRDPLEIAVKMNKITQETAFDRRWEVAVWWTSNYPFFYGEYEETGPIADCDFCDVTLPAAVPNLVDNATWVCSHPRQGLGGTATVSETP